MCGALIQPIHLKGLPNAPGKVHALFLATQRATNITMHCSALQCRCLGNGVLGCH